MVNIAPAIQYLRISCSNTPFPFLVAYGDIMKFAVYSLPAEILIMHIPQLSAENGRHKLIYGQHHGSQLLSELFCVGAFAAA